LKELLATAGATLAAGVLGIMGALRRTARLEPPADRDQIVTKRISFFQQRGSRARLVCIDVVLEGLSPLARWLGEVILTTERGDAAGWIRVRERLTNEQALRLAPRAPWDEPDTEKFIEALRKSGAFDLDSRQERTWVWDSLRRGETGEQYLERHAAEMLTRQLDIIHGPNWGNRKDPPPPTALRVMNAGTPEAEA
jgi:hypothetical protein